MLSVKEIRETSGISREMVDLTGDDAMLSCSLSPSTHPHMPEGYEGQPALMFQKHHLEIDIQLM